jgi:hypothetical protein
MKQLIKKILKEESLSITLLKRIKDDGWADTAELVGGSKNLLDIIGNNKENVITFLLSHYTDLNIKKYGGSILLVDHGYTLLNKHLGLGLVAYDDYFKSRLNINIYGLYVHYRKDLIKELVSRYPELYSKEVDVYKDSGLYTHFDTFYL